MKVLITELQKTMFRAKNLFLCSRSGFSQPSDSHQTRYLRSFYQQCTVSALYNAEANAMIFSSSVEMKEIT